LEATLRANGTPISVCNRYLKYEEVIDTRAISEHIASKLAASSPAFSDPIETAAVAPEPSTWAMMLRGGA